MVFVKFEFSFDFIAGGHVWKTWKQEAPKIWQSPSPQGQGSSTQCEKSRYLGFGSWVRIFLVGFIAELKLLYINSMNIDFGPITWGRIMEQHFLLEFAVDWCSFSVSLLESSCLTSSLWKSILDEKFAVRASFSWSQSNPKCDLSLATDFSAFSNHVFMWLLPHFVDLSPLRFFFKKFCDLLVGAT